MTRTVLITGGATGIGKAIVEKLYSKGYNVCFSYNKSEKEALNIIENMKNLTATNSIVAVKSDITKMKDRDNLIKECIKIFGKIDILVNNAAISEYTLFIDKPQNDIVEMFETNILAAIFLSKECIKNSMLKNNFGRIVNIGSIWAEKSAAMEVIYSTTKAALVGFTKALAKEVASNGITVNTISPGATNTKMVRDNFSKEEIEDIKQEIPMQRLAEPKEIADLIFFMVSDKAGYITGQNIGIDGAM